MEKRRSGPEVVFDTSQPFARTSRSQSYANEWKSFMSSNVADMYKKPSNSKSAASIDSEEDEIDMDKVLKDIEYLGSSSMSWKERKAMENRKVVILGGKSPKRQRLPLSVAKVPMKRQKLREEKKLQEEILLGKFQRKKKPNKQPNKWKKPEAHSLMAGDGIFKKGVLNVKHLLTSSAQPKADAIPSFSAAGGGRWKGKSSNNGKKTKGKRR
ncbi:axoneme-associated protein MST101(2) protein [Wolffia australiana]